MAGYRFGAAPGGRRRGFRAGRTQGGKSRGAIRQPARLDVEDQDTVGRNVVGAAAVGDVQKLAHGIVGDAVGRDEAVPRDRWRATRCGSKNAGPSGRLRVEVVLAEQGDGVGAIANPLRMRVEGQHPLVLCVNDKKPVGGGIVRQVPRIVETGRAGARRRAFKVRLAKNADGFGAVSQHIAADIVDQHAVVLAIGDEQPLSRLVDGESHGQEVGGDAAAHADAEIDARRSGGAGDAPEIGLPDDHGGIHAALQHAGSGLVDQDSIVVSVAHEQALGARIVGGADGCRHVGC